MAVPAVLDAVSRNWLVVIDEIGPMEIFSQTFCQTVIIVLISDASLLGTIVKRRNSFADTIKRIPLIRLIEVTLENRESLPQKILKMLLKNFREDREI